MRTCHAARSAPWSLHPALLPAFLFILALVACTKPEEGDHWIDFNLSQSLSAYDRVEIVLVSAEDTGAILEEVWNDKIQDPSRFKKHRLTKAKGKRFIVRIRGYNANGDLLYSKQVPVDGTSPADPEIVLADIRIHGLTTRPEGLSPDFSPDVYAYALQVPADQTKFTLKALPMASSSRLTINGHLAGWNEDVVLDLTTTGANPFSLVASDAKDRSSAPYILVVTRGEVVSPDKVTSVAVTPKDLVLYTRDTSSTLGAKVEPAGALVEWSSQNDDVVTVGVTGRVSPVGEGSTTVTAKAGAHSDRATVEVKKAPPVLDVGNNAAVKLGTEVEFKISLTLTRATVVSFKHALEGAVAWDAGDTARVPESIRHVYAAKGRFEARFEVKDSRGNVVTTTRTITVGDGDHSLTILSPSNDTVVNTSTILVRYDLDGTVLSKEMPLPDEGLNTVAIDTMGVSNSVRVIRDTQPPKAPEVEVAGVTADRRPAWNWKSGGEGAGLFRSSLDSSTLPSAAASTARSHAPASDLAPGPHTLFVQERDAAGNWSPAGKATVTVLAPDNTPPNMPEVIGTTPTNEAPKWTWSSGGGGGSGDFRHKLNDTALSTGATNTRELSYTLTNAVSGTSYTLHVQERDAAGNWSKAGSHAILFDQTKPTVSIVTPKNGGTYYTREATLALSGKALGNGTLTIARVAYKLGGGAETNASFAGDTWNVPSLSLAEGATAFTVTAYDNLGNASAPQTLNIHHDRTNPNPPILQSSPTTPTKATKGSWSWAAGADNAEGSGLDGQYRYSLDGGANWTMTQATLVSDLSLPEGTLNFLVQERDHAGNWSSSAPSVIKVDRTAPRVTIATPAQGAELAAAVTTASGTAADDGTGIASVLVTGQVSGSGATTPAGGTWSTGDLTVRASRDTLIATATDLAGNSASDTSIITVNIPAPAVEITYPPENHITNKDTITVRYRVNGGAEQTKPFQLTAEGTIPLGVEVAGGGGTPGKDTVRIVRDVTPPNAPTVATAARWTKTSPAWTWTSNGDNAGGTGVASTLSYQFQVNGAGGWTNQSAASHSIANPAEGAYTIVVQQMDRAGNWSANSNAVVVNVDRTLPVVSVKSPANNYITSAAAVDLVCTVDGQDQPAVSSALTEGANTLTCSRTDSAGNTGSQAVTAWRRAHVLFVRVGGTGNSANSNSWATAFGSLQAAITAAASSASLQKQIWVAGGTYTAGAGITLKSGISIFGGFSPTAFGHNLGSRTFAAADTVRLVSTLANGADALMYMTGTTAAPIDNDTLDGLLFRVAANQRALKYDFARKAYIGNCQFMMSSSTYMGISGWGADISIVGSRFSGLSGTGLVIHAETSGQAGWLGALRIQSSVFSGNTMSASGDLAFIRATVATTSITGSELRDPVAGGGFQVKGNGTSLTITGNTVRGTAGILVSGTWTSSTTAPNTYVVNF